MQLYLGNGTSTNQDSGYRQYDDDPVFLPDSSCYNCIDYRRELAQLRQLISELNLYTLTEEDKEEIALLVDEMFVETVSGTDVVINGVANTRYNCGTVSSITIHPPATGIIDVVFTSGTSLPIVTIDEEVMMPEWLEWETERVYEVNIRDGRYGMVMSWPLQ